MTELLSFLAGVVVVAYQVFCGGVAILFTLIYLSGIGSMDSRLVQSAAQEWNVPPEEALKDISSARNTIGFLGFMAALAFVMSIR